MKIQGVQTGSLYTVKSLNNSPVKKSLLTTAIGLSAAAFSDSVGWPNGVSTLLENLGKATGVSRAWIFQVLKITETHVYQNYTFEWAKSEKFKQIAEQRTAERNLDNVEFLQTSVFDKTFSPGSFDLVMAFFVLHFFEDIDAVFKRVHELLQPGGVFISETACLGNKNKLMGSLLRFAGHLGFLPKINLLTIQQLEQSLKRAGFSIVEKIKFSKHSDAEFTLIAKKI
ncbi:MAG: class I SAM-dependent methyltransferase [Gammaproteobacteria bacterium]|jgi:SAM-dependent methyltransferase|nr:class I SAM-dependent methyltransferase [Gammaproteobacteria bacterium]MBT4077326.1 class I SAM-dependent methyltransferase [Gammaproteobacteria bacterium]MBT4195926.1 class I SAM-dependent methyltransferase [Gammaproteobacteria bacterium]MBT4450428.1 class I SAM-dependent methyltransferase [Gammaproteobacteria bacterium]MBT4859206.1 class I SAM-dependent methyltransferase [Gammaproteobacteria bacterium]